MPTSPGAARHARRHNPLSDDLLATGPLKSKATAKRKSGADNQEEARYVDSKASRKILKIGQDLVEEEQEENVIKPAVTAFEIESRFGGDNDEAENIHHSDDDGDEAWGDEEEEIVEEVELDPNDLDMFNRFMPTNDEEPPLIPLQTPHDQPIQGQGTNLADLILEKIAAHEAAESGQRVVIGGGPPEDAIEMPAKVVEVYTKSVPPTMFYEPHTNDVQDRTPPLAVQIRQTPQTLQNHPNPPQLGRHPLHHSTRLMDPQRLLRSYQDLRLRKANHDPALPRVGNPRTST